MLFSFLLEVEYDPVFAVFLLDAKKIVPDIPPPVALQVCLPKMLSSVRSGLSRQLAYTGCARCFTSGTSSSIASSLPARSISIGSSVLDDQEQALAQRISDAKAAMIQHGYHGPSLWTQVICWGDHDQVRSNRLLQISPFS